MGLVADAVLDAGGPVHGVIPEHLVRMETAHPGLTSLDVVGSMHERKARMEDLSDGFIVLPGGLGTFDEAFEILTWNQLGLIAKPIVFVDIRIGTDTFFGPLFHAVDHMVAEGFIQKSASALLQRSESVEVALDLAASAAPVVEAKLGTLDITAKRGLR